MLHLCPSLSTRLNALVPFRGHVGPGCCPFEARFRPKTGSGARRDSLRDGRSGRRNDTLYGLGGNDVLNGGPEATRCLKRYLARNLYRPLENAPTTT